MKILVVHNDYGKYSGEEAVVDRFIADATAIGHEVETLRRTSRHARENILGNVHGFFAGIYSKEGVRAMREKLQSFRPDVVNVHNLYPFLSPAVLKECRAMGIPVVMTVHNYRLICPTGLFLRHDKACERCLATGNEWPCLLHNCEHSLPRSLGYATRNSFARLRKYYRDNVDCYCCLTSFQREKLIEAGFDKEKIVIIPNYIQMSTATHKETHTAPAGKSNYIGYVGRLSREKGYDLLFAIAVRHPEWHFRFAGEIRPPYPSYPPNVTLCGNLSPQELTNFYRDACCIALPSRCYEGFPMALLEAYAAGKPCIAPRHGAFPQLVGEGGEACGLLFTPNNVADLERAIEQMLNNPGATRAMGINALQNVQQHYSREIVITKWDKLLQRIVAHKASPQV